MLSVLNLLPKILDENGEKDKCGVASTFYRPLTLGNSHGHKMMTLLLLLSKRTNWNIPIKMLLTLQHYSMQHGGAMISTVALQ